VKAPNSFIEFLRAHHPNAGFPCTSSGCPIAEWLMSFERWSGPEVRIFVADGIMWVPGRPSAAPLPLWAREFVKWHDQERPTVRTMLQSLRPL
jgi:hypothetical protein